MSQSCDKSTARESVATEAADWYARLRAEDVSEMDMARFRAWTAGDPARRREFEAIEQLWKNLSALEDSPEVQRERQAAARRRAKSASSLHGGGRSFPWAAVAAAVLLVFGAFVWTERAPVDHYITRTGEQRTVSLADGSVVTLNTATEIRLHFSPERRNVELLAGQANFAVAKDPNRPFVVTAGDRAVRAVGTQFDVYKTADKVIVTLIEGKVAVFAPAGPKEIVLSAGEQLSYGVHAEAIERKRADIPRVEAWRARKLDFDDTPLMVAIAEANRYSATQIVLDAPELEDARISGRFDAGRNDLFVEGLQAYFHFHVEHTSDHLVVLTPAH